MANRRQFWEIIKDDRSKTYELLRLSSDDTDLTNITCEMQRVGMHVRCETVEYPRCSKEDIPKGYERIGFTEEKGLFERLKHEYARKVTENVD